MKLNHDIYEEAMDNVRLSEDRGMKLLEEAVRRDRHRRQKARVQAAAIIAVFLTVALSVNGICYAQTGKNAWEMFTVFFQNSHEGEMTEFVEKAKESGESFTYKNLKFTLEQYLYDKENLELFYTVLVESTDGTPLDQEQMFEDYIITVKSGRGTGRAQTEWSEDKTSYREFGVKKSNYDESGRPMDMEKLEVCIYEGDCPAIGSFDIEPTGRMKTRYLDVSFMDGCSQKGKITGTGVKLFFEKRWFESGIDDTAKNRPFERLDVVMKDGVVFRGGSRMGRDVIPVYNGKGELLNGKEIQEATKAEDIRECYEEWSCGEPTDDEYWLSYRINFPEFINVDDIDAVYLDNVRLPLE